MQAPPAKKARVVDDIESGAETGSGDDLSDGGSATGSESESEQVDELGGPIVKARVGTIERIQVPPISPSHTHTQLENFMCHRNFDIQFGTRINFVSGQNGSGKSAIVAALQVLSSTAITNPAQLCLGAKARTTNRGESLSSLITKGQQLAVVRVHLKNEGAEAYRGDHFGSVRSSFALSPQAQTVVVERSIRLNGGSDYKIRRGPCRCSADLHCRCKVVENGRSALQPFLDHAAIQIDNPVTILTQDESKTFLSMSTPQDKYKFFLRATQLGSMRTQIDAAASNKDITEEELSRKRQGLEEMKVQFEQARRAYNDLDSMKNLQIQEKEANEQLVWALVEEADEERESHVQALREIAIEMEPLAAAARAAQADVDEAARQSRNMANGVMSTQSGVNEIDERLKVVQMSATALKREVRQKENDVKRIREKVDRKEKEINQMLESAKRLRRKSQQDHGHVMDKRRQKFDQARLETEQLEAEIAEVTRIIDQLRDRTDVDTQAKVRAANASQQMSSQVQMMESHLAAARNSRRNELLRFGQQSPRIVELIAKNNDKFDRPPIGPVGLYIRLKPEMQKWEEIINRHFRLFPMTFLCHSTRDEATLSRLIGNTRGIQLLVTAFKTNVHNMPPSRLPSRAHPTVLNGLDFDTAIPPDVPPYLRPTVINACIDRLNVESVVLCDDLTQASNIIDQDPNATMVLRLGGGVFRKQRGGSSYQDRVPDRNLQSFLFVDAGRQEMVMEDRLGDVKRNAAAAKRALTAATQAASEGQRLLQDKEKAKNRLLDKLARAKLRRDEAEDALNERDPGDLAEDEAAGQEREAEESRAELNAPDGLLQRLQAATAVWQEAQSRLEPLLEKVEEIEAEQQELVKATEDEQRRVERLEEQEQAAARQLGKAQLRLQKVEAKHHKVDSDLATAIAIVERLRAQALASTGGRVVPVTRSRKDLEKRIGSLKLQIQKEEEKQGDPVEITRIYRDASDKLKKASEAFREVEITLNEVRDNLRFRISAWRAFRKHVAKRTKHFFNREVQRRGASGNIVITREQLKPDGTVRPGTLDITVNLEHQAPSQDGAASQSAQDTRQLSGGERSFATVAFLVALWHAVESPFRVLDEFDVCMDVVHRAVALTAIVDSARRADAKQQFIIISPNPRALQVGLLITGDSLEQAEDVQHHELAAPVRL